MVTNLIRLLVLASCLASAAVSTSAQAAGGGSVNLMATLHNAPAFTPIEWKVMRMDNKKTVGSSRAHTLNLPLSPGTYKAVATYKGDSRSRIFTVSSKSRTNVVIAMD